MLNFDSEEGRSLESETGQNNASFSDDSTEIAPKKIRWDGGGVLLGETDNLAYSQHSFLQTVSEYLSGNRPASVRHLVRQYPDIALTVLQEAKPDGGNEQALESIASTFDELWCRPHANPWQTYVREIQTMANRGQFERRDQFWRYLKQDEPGKAVALKLVSTIARNNASMTRAEFCRLESIALMMAGDYEQAIQRLQRSIEYVQDDCPFLVSKLQLLLGEYYRHDQQLEKWKQTWVEAVRLNSEIVDRAGSPDPMFWDRAAFLRPAGIDWPEKAMGYLNSYLQTEQLLSQPQSAAVSSDAIVLFIIGHRHMERGEGQNALLALKKAETAAEGHRGITDTSRLMQARALIAAGQPGAASAILYRLVSEFEGQLLADRAKAVLGAMKMQHGGVLQGLNLMQSAIESVHEWPRNERLRAQADYSLALLVTGREQEGLELLDQVHQEFMAIGKHDQAHQCLWNKAKYFEKTKQDSQYQMALSQLDSIESR